MCVSRNRDQPWSYRYCEITLSCPARVRAQLTFRVGGIWELAELRYTLRRQGGSIPLWTSKCQQRAFPIDVTACPSNFRVALLASRETPFEQSGVAPLFRESTLAMTDRT